MTTPQKPNYRWKGILAAISVLSVWGSLTVFLVTRESPGLWVLLIPVSTFLWTGLFITAHDAMHGLIAPEHPKLNVWFGRIATFCYAAFPFDRFKEAHLMHHQHPGEPGKDPDFHDGKHPSFVRWYLRFVMHYTSIAPIVFMAVLFNVLQHIVGLSAVCLVLFWVVPSLLSGLQLFYFGTYLPHRSPARDGDPHHAVSNPYPTWLSFLTCYHFGYHREHHHYPWVPWWRLPSARRMHVEAA